MIDSIKEKIEMQKEVLTALPTNNKKNLDKYIKCIENYRNEFSGLLNDINIEIDSRKRMFDGLCVNSDIDILKREIDELEREMVFVNPYNSSYEKMGLDRVIYDINKFYKFDLEKVNGDILTALNIFKDVGVVLVVDDFDCIYLRDYMKVFFDNIDSLDNAVVKKTFEGIYWECSDLLAYVSSAFRSLYFKYKKRFDSYVANRVKGINEKYKDGIYEEYLRVKNVYNDLVLRDTYLIIDEFRSKNLSFADFSDEKIQRTYDELLCNNEKSDLEKIKAFYYGLDEFLDYNRVKYLIDDMKVVYAKLKDYKSNTKNLFKQLNKNEKLINKFNRKIDFYKKYHLNYSSLPNKINELIMANKGLYDDIDEGLFMDNLRDVNPDDISYIDVIRACYGNYLYLIKCIKKSDDKLSDADINVKVKEVRKVYFNSRLTFLKHLSVLVDKNVNMVISDGYSLSGFRIKPEDFDNESGILLLKQLAYKIIVYNSICESKYSFDDIEFYINVK